MLGVFDSGLGGLTAVKELKKLLPRESIIYFGDTGRTPYGTRSADTIIKYAAQDTRFLISHNVDAILVACGTVSSTAIDHLKTSFSVPIVGVIDAACECAVKVNKNGKIGVIGTSATVNSHAYEKKIAQLSPEAKTVSVACPLFVPLVENGFTDDGNEVTALVAKQYLAPIKESGCDTLILGCTHYPMIENIISKQLPGVTLISSGKEAALRFRDTAEKFGLLGKDTSHTEEYYISDEGSSFKKIASGFLGEDISDKVRKINIESF